MTKNRQKIETKRLLLRPFELSDGLRVQELAGDKAIADTTVNIPYPYADGMAEVWIATHQPKSEAGELECFAIVLRSTQQLIGAIGLDIEAMFNRAELGYWISKQCWNHGYCTEAARAMVNYGFEVLELNKITASHFIRNPASGKVMEKIGMEKEGILRDYFTKWDVLEDGAAYGILRKQWEAGI